jgi:hypothetical protein
MQNNQFISDEPARNAPGPKPSRKLFSMAAVMQGRAFAGKFETESSACDFIFTPVSAALKQGKLELHGNLSLGQTGGMKREIRGARATLLATQGGIYGVPAPLLARIKTADATLPVTEATGPRGFVGAMYFRLAPIDSKAAGLKIDLSRVQLNARLAPTSDIERQLQVIYTDLVAATFRTRPDTSAANEQLALLNRLLSRA